MASVVGPGTVTGAGAGVGCGAGMAVSGTCGVVVDSVWRVLSVSTVTKAAVATKAGIPYAHTRRTSRPRLYRTNAGSEEMASQPASSTGWV